MVVILSSSFLRIRDRKNLVENIKTKFKIKAKLINLSVKFKGTTFEPFII